MADEPEASGAAESVDDQGGEDGREDEEPWATVEGTGRCRLCVKTDSQCRIKLGFVEKWKADVEGGKTFFRNPPGTLCERCHEKKKKCELPATKWMRERTAKGATEDMEETEATEAPVDKGKRKAVEKSGSITPSVASSSKRKLEFAGVELPLPKRRREEVLIDERVLQLMKQTAEGAKASAEANTKLAEAIAGLATAIRGSTAATGKMTGVVEEFLKGAKKHAGKGAEAVAEQGKKAEEDTEMGEASGSSGSSGETESSEEDEEEEEKGEGKK